MPDGRNCTYIIALSKQAQAFLVSMYSIKADRSRSSVSRSRKAEYDSVPNWCMRHQRNSIPTDLAIHGRMRQQRKYIFMELCSYA